MWKIIISLFLLGYTQSIVGQSVLLYSLPNVKVVLSNNSKIQMQFEEIILVVKLENISEEVQKVLFDKPHQTYPWGTFVTIVNEKGDTVSARMNKEILSSTLYSEEQLKSQNVFYYLPPHATIQRSFKLSDIVILKNFGQDLAPGKYRLNLSYYGNQSNSIVLNIVKEKKR